MATPDLATGTLASKQTSGSTFSILNWVAVLLAGFIPIYRILPSNLGQLWTLTTLGFLTVVLTVGLGKRPKGELIWIFAGYAALGSGITSSGASGLSSTAATAIQLFVLLSIGPFAIRGLISRNHQLAPKLCASFLIVQSASAFVGILQLFGISVLDWSQSHERSPGLAGHPNILGIMSSLAILICIATLLRPTFDWLPRTIVTCILALNVGGLLVTGSLSSMGACALGVFILLYAHGFRMIRISLVATISAILLWNIVNIPVVSNALRNPVERFYQVTGQTQYLSTMEIRLDTYAAAWDYLARDPLLGRGISNADSASIDIGTVVHNLPLRAWYQGGILLGLAISIIFLAIIIVTFQSVVSKQHALAVSVMVTMLSYSLTSAFFEQTYYWVLVLVAWATIPPSRKNLTALPPRESPAPGTTSELSLT